MQLRQTPGLPDPNIQPPTVAEVSDPFSELRVVHLLARLPRGSAVRIRDIVDQLDADYLDWSFSREVVVQQPRGSLDRAPGRAAQHRLR